MMPVGYMAKRVSVRPDWLNATQVKDIYSVSNCVSADFADYTSLWRHNGYWFFDTPALIRATAREKFIRLGSTSLFFYEAYEVEFDGKRWRPYGPVPVIETSVVPPHTKHLEGFDVVTFSSESSPECCPLSCNGVADLLHTNEHCLLTSFEDAGKKLKTECSCERANQGLGVSLLCFLLTGLWLVRSRTRMSGPHGYLPSTSLAIVCSCMFDVPS
jgi:hypothetical protein